MQTRLFLRLIFRNLEIYLLKIVTLAIAFTTLVLVTVFALNEFGYDKFHQNSENIFRVIEKNETETYAKNKYGSKISNNAYASLNSNLTLARTKVLNEVSAIVEGKTIHNLQMHVADTNITNIFTFNILNGELEDFQKKSSSILLSKSLAEQYFGTSEVNGKEISLFTFGDTLHLKIAAVYQPFPSNSHQDFQAFIHYNHSSLKTLGFDASISEVYGVNRGSAELHLPQSDNKSYTTQALTDIYFGPRMAGEEVEHGDLYSVIILISITSLILFLALTGFINLTSLALPHRVKELAIKKLAGHDKFQLALNFIGESLVISLISFAFGGLILWVCLETIKPIQVFNFPMLIRQELASSIFVVLGLLLILALAPLLMIRKFINATATKLLSSEAITFPRFKKVIIILQLGISIFLIVSANVINRQVTYSLVKEPGRNNYQVVYVNYPDDMTDDQFRRLRDSWKKFKHNIVNVMATSQLPNQISSRDLNTEVYSISVDSEFNEFFDLEMDQGCWFGPNDGDSIMVVNESAFQKIGSSSSNIKGVYKDFSQHFNLPDKPTKIVRGDYFNHNFLFIRILEVDILKTIESLERYFERDGRQSNLQFMDKKFESWLNYQVRLNSLTNLLTIIAALLSCCAIYGLSISVVRDKLKQIAIRKICGAELRHIIYLLVKEFTINLLIAILFFAPITYIVLEELLRAFVYSTQLNWIDPIYPLIYCVFVIVVLCSWKASTLNRSDLSGALKE
jgi:putative ABC transport system permease protein